MNAPVKPVRPGRDRPTQPRLLRELATIEAMTQIYCANHHHSSKPCGDCQALIDYAAKRLAVCPFSDEKPVCAKCQIHCYGKTMREKVRDVMRYAGPRMIWRHPWLALMHVVDKRYVAPPKPSAATPTSKSNLPPGAKPGSDALVAPDRASGVAPDSASASVERAPLSG